MNCPINYEDPEENMNTKCKRKNPISAGKMVTWKVEIATLFKTPQECVGQNKIRHNKPTMDKRVGRTKCPRNG